MGGPKPPGIRPDLAALLLPFAPVAALLAMLSLAGLTRINPI